MSGTDYVDFRAGPSSSPKPPAQPTCQQLLQRIVQLEDRETRARQRAREWTSPVRHGSESGADGRWVTAYQLDDEERPIPVFCFCVLAMLIALVVVYKVHL